MNIRRPLAELSALVVLIELLSCAMPAFGATTNVLMNSFSFSPAVVNIRAGDTVVWTYQAGSPHTVTGNTQADPFCGNTSFGPGTTCSITFTNVGSFSYICVPHAASGMTGLVVVAAANLAPIVSITSPTNGAKFLTGTPFTLAASATDPDGTVARVDFVEGTSVEFSLLSAPFSTNVIGDNASSHTVVAVATDNAGLSSTSAPITVTFITTNLIMVPFNLISTSPAFTLSNSAAGQQYFVDALTNFTGTLSTRWFPIATNTAPSNNFIFTDGVLTSPVPRLYRIRQAL